MKNNGFTLIEVMIVIALIGILSTMALPSFQDRVIRTQVQEALQLAAFAQEEVQQYYKTTMKLPEDNKVLGLPAPEKIVGNYVTNLTVSDGGRIDITLGNRINKHAENRVISLRPAIVEDAAKVPIAWVTGHASVPNGMVVKSENRTDLEIRHLPMRCRY